MKNEDYLKHCKDFSIVLINNDLKYINVVDLYSTVFVVYCFFFRFLLEEDINLLQALKNPKKNHIGPFPGLTIALRIILTIPITIACAGRSFLKTKLMLIKRYFWNRLDQRKKLNKLEPISIEEENIVSNRL